MAVSIGSITSANATFTLTVAGLFTSPQAIQQFGVDDAFDSEAVENGEIVEYRVQIKISFEYEA